MASHSMGCSPDCWIERKFVTSDDFQFSAIFPTPLPPTNTPVPPPTNTPSGPRACNDGIDNDGDGHTDFPNDPGCRNNGDDDEGNSTNTQIPNSILTMQAAFSDVDQQMRDALSSSIAYNAPKTMKLDETIVIELLLNPLLSGQELETEVVDRRDLSTSTANPDLLINEQGSTFVIESSRIEITSRMKAALSSQDDNAFVIQQLHSQDEQAITTVDTTKWRWSVTAKEQGTRILELTIFRLIKIDGEDNWREVGSYENDIEVLVSPSQQLVNFDWKWILGILFSALLIPLFFRWYDNRKRKNIANQDLSKPIKKRGKARK